METLECLPTPAPAEATESEVYRIHDDIDLSFLVSAEVTQVAVGPSHVSLRFHPEPLSVELKTTCIVDGRTVEAGPPTGHALLCFLEKSVIAWRRDSELSLTLLFSDGHELELVDDEDHYESFETWGGPSSCIIV